MIIACEEMAGQVLRNRKPSNVQKPWRRGSVGTPAQGVRGDSSQLDHLAGRALATDPPALGASDGYLGTRELSP